MQPTVSHLRYPAHDVLVVNTDSSWQICIPTAVELTILLTTEERFERPSLKDFAWVPVFPPLKFSLTSGEIRLVNDYQVQIAGIRLNSHCRPTLALVWGDTKADLAAPAQIQVPRVDTRPLGHCFEKIAVAAVVWKRPWSSGHQVSIHELEPVCLRKVV